MIYLMVLFCSIFCSGVNSQEPTAVVQTKVGTLTLLSGSAAYVYSAGEKKLVSEKQVPYTIYSGDEVQAPVDSNCEIILVSGSTIYVAPETLVSLDKKGGDVESVFLKYGIVMFRGVKPVDLKASDIYVRTISGDFLARYKKVDFELTLLNFGQDLFIKQTNDKLPLKVAGGKYVKALSFKDQKYWGNIIPGSIGGLYERFKVPFRPEGSSSHDDFSPTKAKESTEDTVYKAADVDKVKRTTGI
jgi:hypothetical protein